MKRNFLILFLLQSLLSGCGGSAKTYKVTWVNDDNEELKVEENIKTNTHPIFDKENPSSGYIPEIGHHYSFSGWKDENGNEYTDDYLVIDHDVTFTAVYDNLVNVHLVTWLDNQGNEIDHNNWEYGTHPTHTIPEPTGEASVGHHFVFDKWTSEDGDYTDSFLMPDHDVTFTATFRQELNSYMVTWLNDDGSEIDCNEWNYGAHPNHSTPTAKLQPDVGYHFEFVNWVDNSGKSFSQDYTMPDHDVTFTAIYRKEINTHKVTWLDNQGNEIDHNNWDYGSHPTHDIPQPSGEPSEGHHFEFNKWASDDGDYTDSFLMPDNDVTFKALFFEIANTHVITWLNDDGTEIDHNVLDYGMHPTHTIPEPTGEASIGHHLAFDKWTSEDGDYTDTFLMPDHNVTFKANFVEEANVYTIKWEIPDGSIDTTYVKYGETPTHKNASHTPDPDKQDSYHFDGWFDGDTKLNADYKVIGDVTFKPRFTVCANGGCDYELNESKDGYRVIGLNKYCTSPYITILDTYHGLPVVSVDDNAFRNQDSLESLTIGKNVEIIGESAFRYTYLKEIDFSSYGESKLKTICREAFFGTEIETFKAPANLESIGEWAFNTDRNTLITVDLTLPDHVVNVASYNTFGEITRWLKFYVKNEEMMGLYKSSWPSNFYDHFMVQG